MSEILFYLCYTALSIILLCMFGVVFKTMFQVILPKGFFHTFCNHRWQFDKSIQTYTSVEGISASGTKVIYKCEKCGDIKAI